MFTWDNVQNWKLGSDDKDAGWNIFFYIKIWIWFVLPIFWKILVLPVRGRWSNMDKNRRYMSTGISNWVVLTVFNFWHFMSDCKTLCILPSLVNYYERPVISCVWKQTDHCPLKLNSSLLETCGIHFDINVSANRVRGPTAAPKHVILLVTLD